MKEKNRKNIPKRRQNEKVFEESDFIKDEVEGAFFQKVPLAERETESRSLDLDLRGGAQRKWKGQGRLRRLKALP